MVHVASQECRAQASSTTIKTTRDKEMKATMRTAMVRRKTVKMKRTSRKNTTTSMATRYPKSMSMRTCAHSSKTKMARERKKTMAATKKALIMDTVRNSLMTINKNMSDIPRSFNCYIVLASFKCFT